MFIITIIILSIISWIVYNHLSSRYLVFQFCNPPSPPRLPIIGHLHLMRKYPDKPWKVFNELARSYGEVYKLQLGQCNYVVIAGADAAKEALIKNGKFCLDRPLITTWNLLAEGQKNSPHFESWSTNHNHIRKSLIVHTLSGSSMKFGHLNDISEKGIRKFISSDANIHLNVNIEFLLCMYIHIILDYICGTNFLDTRINCDNRLNLFIEAFTEVHDTSLNGHIIDIFPILKHLKYFFPSIRKMCKSYNYIIRFLVSEAGLEENRRKLQNVLHPQEYDHNAFSNLSSIFIQKHIEDPLSFSWTKCSTVIGASVGGFIPISLLTMVCLGHLSVNKEYQEKIYRKICEVKVGSKNDMVSLEEIQNLVYTQAALLETIRLTCPPHFPRLTTQDITIKEYHIPKGATILINIHSLNHSPQLWESPESFMPERFLVPEGNGEFSRFRIWKPSYFYPYGIGGRYCPGYGLFENLASLVVANLIHQYKVYSDDDIDLIGMLQQSFDNYGSFRVANFFKLNLIKRSLV